MTDAPFEPSFEALPCIIPIFPLPGALLLPRGHLPLQIFEPRYRAMMSDALAGERFIGMIQPTDEDAAGPQPGLYGTGCAGWIETHRDTPDGRYFLTLTGVCRFRIIEELPLKDGYRRVVAEYQRFRADLAVEPNGAYDRDRLLACLRGYLEGRGSEANWEAIEEASDEMLVNSLAMICPFNPSEKQALLEAGDLCERAQMMMTLIEMARLDRTGGSERLTH